ncbi:MAG: hypothetical protein OXC00_07315 [Acidimicrobiaceae bacterium]|nr:hypothetical protein [Acidimicrobiaceae bacterium]
MDDVLLVGPGGAYEAVVDAGAEPAVFSVSLESTTALPLRRLSNQQAGRVRRVADPELSRKFRAVAANALRSWEATSQSISVPRAVVRGLMLELLTAPSAAQGSSHGSIQLFVGAGLNEMEDTILADDGMTFFQRCARAPLSPLSEAEARFAIEQPILNSQRRIEAA